MCSMSAGLRSTPARRTQQMIVIQDKVHTEAPYTTDFLSRRTLFPSLLPVLSNTSTPSTVYLEREKDHRLTAVKKKELYPLISPSCLEDSRGHWDSRLWYGLQNFCYVQGRGDWLFSLTWQPNESLEC